MIKVVLSSALSRAMREELVPRNVAQLITLPVEHRVRRTAWTAAQARVFLRAAADDPAYPVGFQKSAEAATCDYRRSSRTG
jgi:hypothetical protein